MKYGLLFILALSFGAASKTCAQSLNKYFNSNKTGRIERGDATRFQRYVTQLLDGQFAYADSCKTYISGGSLIAEGDISILLTNIGKHSRSTQQGAILEEIFDFLCKKRNIDFGKLNFQQPALYTLLSDYYNRYNGKLQAKDVSLLTFRNLIEHGASVNTFDSQGRNLLTLATDVGDKEFQSYLINKGLNASGQSFNGTTIIDQFIANGNAAALKVLAESGQFKDFNLWNCSATREQIHANPEVEKLVSEHLGKGVETYDDFIRFRQLVTIPNATVETKAEALCREKFTNLVGLIDHLTKNPGDNIAERLLLEFYHKDVKTIDRYVDQIKAGGSLSKMFENWDWWFIEGFPSRYEGTGYPYLLLPESQDYIMLARRFNRLPNARFMDNYQKPDYLEWISDDSSEHLKKYLMVRVPVLGQTALNHSSIVAIAEMSYTNEYPKKFAFIQSLLKEALCEKISIVRQHLSDEKERIAKVLKNKQNEEHAKANSIRVVDVDTYKDRGETTYYFKMSDGEELSVHEDYIDKINRSWRKPLPYRFYGVSIDGMGGPVLKYRGASGENSTYWDGVCNAAAAVYVFKKYRIVRTIGLVK